MKTSLRTLVAAAAVAAFALGSSAFAAEEKPLPKEIPPFGADKPLPVPPIDTSKTAEGLTVWIVKRPSFPKTTVILAVRGGTAADPKGLEGVSELLASTVKDGTPTRTSKKIAEELQRAGADISANAGPDAVIVTVDGLSSGTDKLLAVLADVARNASFPADEVKLAKANALQGLQARMSTPEFLASKAFAQAIYGSHPYHVTAPTPDVINAATPEILKQEFARRFRPDRSLLVVVGDVDVAATKKTVNAAFAGWKVAGEAAPPTPPGPPAEAGRRIFFVDRPNSVQSQIVAGRPGPRASDPDYYPAVVANTIFGGAFGSRLVKNIREEKGYTYSPGANVAPRQMGGLLRVRADVRNEVTAASLMEIFYELDRMGATKPTEEEITTAKRYQSGLYLLRNQIQGAIASILANNWVNGLPPEAMGEFVTKVNAVTVADIQKVGRSLFASGRQTVVVVGDSGKVKGDVGQFGDVADLKP